MPKLNERGSALLISLFCISLLMYMAAAFLSMSVNNYKMAKFSADSIETVWVAEAGIAQMIHDLRDDYWAYTDLSEEQYKEVIESRHNPGNKYFPNFDDKPKIKTTTLWNPKSVLHLRETTLISEASVRGRKARMECRVKVGSAATDYLTLYHVTKSDSDIESGRGLEGAHFLFINSIDINYGPVHSNGDITIQTYGTALPRKYKLISYKELAGVTLSSARRIFSQGDRDYPTYAWIIREDGFSYKFKVYWDSDSHLVDPADFGGEIRDETTFGEYIEIPDSMGKIIKGYKPLINENWHITPANYCGLESVNYDLTDADGDGIFDNPTRPRYDWTKIELTTIYQFVGGEYVHSNCVGKTIGATLYHGYFAFTTRHGKPCDFSYGHTDTHGVEDIIVKGHILTAADVTKVEDWNASIADTYADIGGNERHRIWSIQQEVDGLGLPYFSHLVELDLGAIPINNFPKDGIIYSEVPLVVKGSPKKAVTVVCTENVYLRSINQEPVKAIMDKYGANTEVTATYTSGPYTAYSADGLDFYPPPGPYGGKFSGYIDPLNRDFMDYAKSEDSSVHPVGIISAKRIYFDFDEIPRTEKHSGMSAHASLILNRVTVFSPIYRIGNYSGYNGQINTGNLNTKNLVFIGSKVSGYRGTDISDRAPLTELSNANVWWQYPDNMYSYYPLSFRRGDDPSTPEREGPPPHTPILIRVLSWRKSS